MGVKISWNLYTLLAGSLVVQSCPSLATPWTVDRQAPLSMGFLRQEYWSGLLFPSPGIFSTQGANSLPTQPPHVILCRHFGKQFGISYKTQRQSYYVTQQLYFEVYMQEKIILMQKPCAQMFKAAFLTKAKSKTN